MSPEQLLIQNCLGSTCRYYYGKVVFGSFVPKLATKLGHEVHELVEMLGHEVQATRLARVWWSSLVLAVAEPISRPTLFHEHKMGGL